MSQHLEIEVKFFLNDIDPVKDTILELGGVSLGRFFEVNIRFDDQHASLYHKNALLRLRKDQKNRLTFKEPPDTTDDQFKIFKEYEIEINDFEKAKALLNAMGFNEVQRYEKWRETFILADTELCIDTMPYGNFLEIEGKKSGILDLIPKISLNWEERILANYLEIFETLKKQFRLDFNDVTFDHFSPISDDMTAIIQSFQQKWKS